MYSFKQHGHHFFLSFFFWFSSRTFTSTFSYSCWAGLIEVQCLKIKTQILVFLSKLLADKITEVQKWWKPFPITPNNGSLKRKAMSDFTRPTFPPSKTRSPDQGQYLKIFQPTFLPFILVAYEIFRMLKLIDYAYILDDIALKKRTTQTRLYWHQKQR